jgi:hypothetical protein
MKTTGVMIFLFAAAWAVTGCDMTPEEKGALDSALTAPTAGAPTEPHPPCGDSCHSERYRQPEGTVHKAVDLLFVTDTSGSLDEERQAIADGIGGFVSELPSDVDYRVAVMLAHGSRSEFSGRLWHKAGHGPVLDSRTLSLDHLRGELKWLLNNTASDIHSDGGEEGLYSFLRGLDHGPLTDSRAKGFFREDAALAVVFISDENDICANYPAGVTRVPDPDGLEGPAFERDCKGVSPQAVLTAIRQLQGDRPFLVGGIVYNNQNYPRFGENEYGYGYMDLIELAQGISIDMAGGHYDTGLSDIGKLVTRKITLLHDFKLPGDAPVDPATIEVRVDGQKVAFEYDASTRSVHVLDAGRALSTIDIDWCDVIRVPVPQPVPSPSPAPSPTPSETPSPQPEPVPTPSPTPCTGFGCGGGVA